MSIKSHIYDNKSCTMSIISDVYVNKRSQKKNTVLSVLEAGAGFMNHLHISLTYNIF